MDEFVDFVTGLVEPKKRPDVSIKRWHKTVLTGTKIQPENKKLKQKTKKKSKRLTRTEFSNLGLFNLPTKSLKYIDLVPIHELWLQYIEKQLQPYLKKRDDGKLSAPEVYESTYENFSRTLMKSDFHGAKIIVESSCNPSLVGQTGIVAMETRNTFKIISQDNRIRSMSIFWNIFFFFAKWIFIRNINDNNYQFSQNYFLIFSLLAAIPKPESVFKIIVNGIEFKIFGKYFNIRPAERAVKKIKTLMHPDL